MSGGDPIGGIPYRLALAGGWIDQPFVSRHLTKAPGSMVVVGLEPDRWYLERAGMATGTRAVARRLWGERLPRRPAAQLVQELYNEENRGRAEPSGSQDMIGLVTPGVSRLDYDAAIQGGVFPRHVETTCDEATLAWLQERLHLLAINQRAIGYNPLGEQRLEPAWIDRLGHSGGECYAAIVARDLGRLGAAMNECMACWEAILPATVRHPTLTVDLPGLLTRYQASAAGAMYSGCGGGYLVVASETPPPGSFRVSIRRHLTA